MRVIRESTQGALSLQKQVLCPLLGRCALVLAIVPAVATASVRVQTQIATVRPLKAIVILS